MRKFLWFLVLVFGLVELAYAPPGNVGRRGVTKLENLTDVDLSTPPDDGDPLEWSDSAGAWVAGTDATGGAGSGAFNDDSDPVVLNTTTKNVEIGDTGVALDAKVQIGGDADEPQLIIEGHTTQADDIFIIQQDDETQVFTVSNAGAVVAAGAISGSNLSGTNTGDNTVATTGDSATSFFSSGTLEVTIGGTGAGTFTDGSPLLGSGTGAITALGVMADGEVMVGDGTGDPVYESGATLRASIGVDAAGTDNSTDVTLAGTPDYITLSGQQITRNAVDLAADVTGTLPAGNGGTGVTSLTDLVTPTILDDDANTPTAGDFVVVETGAASFDYVTPDAGTDVTADLEEETHASEHAVGGADTVFPADPNADYIVFWDDSDGALEGALIGTGLSYDGTTLTGTGGGGDSILVDTSNAIDTSADFQSGGDIDFVFSDGGAGGPDVVTGDINANSVDGTHIALGSDAAGDIMYYNGTDWVRLAKGTAGQVLEMNPGETAPEWDTDDSGGTPAWETIGDAGGVGTIDFAGFDQDITSSEDGGDILTITNSDAVRASDTVTLKLVDADDDDDNVIYLQADSSAGTDFVLKQDSTFGTAIGIGTSTPEHMFHAVSTGIAAGFQLDTYAAGSNGSNNLIRASRGTPGAETTLADGDRLGGVLFSMRDTTGFRNSAAIQSYVDGTPGDGLAPAELRFETRDGSGSSRTVHTVLDADGHFNIAATDFGDYRLGVDGIADEIQLLVQGNGTQTANILEVETSGAQNLFTIDPSGDVTIGDASGESPHLIFNNPSGYNLNQYIDVSGHGHTELDRAVTGLYYLFENTSGSTVTLLSEGGIQAGRTAISSGYFGLFDGAVSNSIQLGVQGASSQSVDIFTVESNTGVEYFTVGSSGSTNVGSAVFDGSLVIYDFDGGGNGTVTIQALDAMATSGASWTWTLPDNDGDSGDVLQTDGSGVTSWVAPGSASFTDIDTDYGTETVTSVWTISGDWVNTANPWADDEVANDITIDLATLATTLTITDNESTNESNAILFTSGGDVDGGNLGIESDGTLTYNPSTGIVTATGFAGDLTGNVTGNASGTAATVTGAAQSAITSVGTLTNLDVDNININLNTISSTAGTDLNITPLAGQQIVLDGTIVVDAGVVTGATSITSTAFVGDLTGNADTVTTNANLTGEVTSSGNATTIADSVAVTDWNLTTPTITTQFTLTAQADPTTDADGEVALDTDGWGSGYDALEYFNGTASAYLVATTASDTPSDGQVPKWNTGGTITWENDADSGGAPDFSAITTGTNTSATMTVGTGATITSSGSGSIVATSGDSATSFFSTGEIADAQVSNTLTSSLFVGSGSSTTAVDLATAEAAGTLTVGKGGTGVATSGTTSQIAVGGGTGSPIVWTTATGTGAPVRAVSPTFTTSMIIPQGTNPTVDAAGKIAQDTTGNQLLYGATPQVLSGLMSKSFVITDPVAASDYSVWKVPYAITITAIHVLVEGGTSVAGGLDETDGNGDSAVAIDADITGSAGTNANDDGTLTNPTLDSGDYLFWHTTTVTGSVTSLTVTFDYRITRT